MQSKFHTFVDDLRTRIERDPLRSFFVGIGIGVLLAIFARALLPLALIVVIVAALLWFFGEDDLAPGEQSGIVEDPLSAPDRLQGAGRSTPLSSQGAIPEQTGRTR